MGKYDDAMYQYLDNNERYADLFNAAVFHGKQVIRGDMLEDGDGRYVVESVDKPRKTTNRYRDLKKRLKSGGFLAVTAVENQEGIDMTMPIRMMELDNQEYKKQLKQLCDNKKAMAQRQGKKAGYYNTRMTEENSLRPIYSLCFYHGTDAWCGPRCLRDLMNFEGASSDWQDLFQDYGMNLFCANEVSDLSLFQTELKNVVEMISYRKDKTKLAKFFRQDGFEHLDKETAEVMAVLADRPGILEYVEEYEEDGEVNMCKAMDDWDKMNREEGRKEGRMETVLCLVRNLMQTAGYTVEQAMCALLIPEEEREEYRVRL